MLNWNQARQACAEVWSELCDGVNVCVLMLQLPPIWWSCTLECRYLLYVCAFTECAVTSWLIRMNWLFSHAKFGSNAAFVTEVGRFRLLIIAYLPLRVGILWRRFQHGGTHSAIHLGFRVPIVLCSQFLGSKGSVLPEPMFPEPYVSSLLCSPDLLYLRHCVPRILFIHVFIFQVPDVSQVLCSQYPMYLRFYAPRALGFHILYSKGSMLPEPYPGAYRQEPHCWHVPRTLCFYTSKFPGSYVSTVLYSQDPIYLWSHVSRPLCFQDPMYLWSYIPRTLSSQYYMFPEPHVSMAQCSQGSVLRGTSVSRVYPCIFVSMSI